jgi:transposase
MLFWSKDYTILSKLLCSYSSLSPKTKSPRVCGVDPGIRNFMTVYDIRGNIEYFVFNKEKVFRSGCPKKYHYKVARALISKYDIIYYGDILMYHQQLRFDLFKKTLVKLANKSNKKVYIVDESFTTKTCSFCGEFNKFMTNEKIYNCEHCKSLIQRDSNAAKNILLKGIIMKEL